MMIADNADAGGAAPVPTQQTFGITRDVLFGRMKELINTLENHMDRLEHLLEQLIAALERANDHPKGGMTND
jgi:hypothetical protein